MTPTPHSHAGAGHFAGFCKSYVPPVGLFDEMEEPDGSVRPHWLMFSTLLDDLGAKELQRRWETARQLIHDNGVTYNVYGDPAGMDRPWNLDAIPMVFDPVEWGRLETALVQRARLLDLILADVYGPQRLLREGLLPPELVFAHRGFLRAMHGVTPPQGRWLHMYAADVARSADGKLWVIADRTQAPSGAGYALENRLVISRALPDVFRDCRVRRLALFFRTMREMLENLAPQNKENPRIVLLTPGPFNETYFEHAYLARYLGYALVEGGDLTVRDNRVFLKTLGGLQQVDVILRRQDDEFCDPLELRTDSALGIAGLVQAVRSGNVTMANALGTGLLECPALMMFLPRLCRHLLGEELRLPSAGTYWCGDATARSHVLANLQRMVIKPTFLNPHRGGEVVFGEGLSGEGLSALRERILASPRDFVGEEQVTLSTAPVFVDGHVKARHVVLRAHLIGAGDGYSMMPGGLTRFSAAADSMIVSMQRGGGSKDTWISSTGPLDTFSLLAPAGQVIEISRSGGDLPSRVADNLYWLGRYTERAEAVARLARGIAARLPDQNFETSPELPVLFTTLIHHAIHDGIPEPGTRPEEWLARVLLDDQYPHGLQATLTAVYRTASLVRDRISIDTWRIINRISQDLPGHPAPRDLGGQLNDIIPGLDRLILTFAAFGGLAMESMTRGFAWRFLDMGRRIERALATVSLLRGALLSETEREGPLLEAILEIADSSMTYRRRYMATLQVGPVLDLLLADASNPRCVAFQLDRLAEHLHELPPTEVSAGLPMHSAIAALQGTDMRRVAEVDEEGHRAGLELLLNSLSKTLHSISDAISQGYLSHAVTSRQLAAANRWGN
ncbi:MAG TPA: circularly permuted type 2 ATP-grasp protein [Phycisphaerae bacterium]|nr:circularly permuted type 2 ATP-grasp protein [Phycisphaerae bacterium]